MQSRPLIDMTLAKTLVLQSISDYQEHKEVKGSNAGIHHGELGEIRALKVKYCLDHLTSDKDIFIVLLALFDNTDSGLFSFNKSKKLISIIANKFITGQRQEGTRGSFINTLASTVFSPELLNLSKSNDSNFDHSSGSGYNFKTYNYLKAIRSMLKIVLDTHFLKEKNEIITAAKTLAKQFNHPSLTLCLGMFANKNKIVAATAGAFLGASPASEEKKSEKTTYFRLTKLPKDLLVYQISPFLTLTDAANLAQVNQAAAKAVKEVEKGNEAFLKPIQLKIR